jgi:hypothetical protein
MASRERSPNYPGHGLDRSLQDLQLLYKRESRTVVPQEVAVKAWGYNSLSGSARSRLAALRHYGLLEMQKNGQVRVSTRGVTLALRSPDTADYKQALRDAALTPTIFQELLDTKRGASDEALVHHLIVNKKFSPDGAKRVLEVYRANAEFAALDQDAADATDIGTTQSPDVSANGARPQFVPAATPTEVPETPHGDAVWCLKSTSTSKCTSLTTRPQTLTTPSSKAFRFTCSADARNSHKFVWRRIGCRKFVSCKRRRLQPGQSSPECWAMAGMLPEQPLQPQRHWTHDLPRFIERWWLCRNL